MAAATDSLTVTNSSSLLNLQMFIETDQDMLDAQIQDVDVENAKPGITYTCEPCKKVYVTKGGYNRHIRRVHQTAHIKLTDGDLESLFQESIAELSVDPCFTPEQQMIWRNMKLVLDPSLSSSIKSVYEKMKSHVNAEKFQTDYTQIIMSASFPLPGLDFMSTVELFRKTGDKILAKFQKSFRGSENSVDNVAPMNEIEIEALEYLGGYVIYNVEMKLKRKPNNQGYLEILRCFESDGVTDQVIINLLNRGGLRGIQNTAKNIFTKAEYAFRKQTLGTIQSIDVFEITRTLLQDLEVTGNMFAATDGIIGMKEEVLFNVVESMILVYLRIRAFSCVRDMSTQKKMEKEAALKEKSLRKTLKKKAEKNKNNEE